MCVRARAVRGLQTNEMKAPGCSPNQNYSLTSWCVVALALIVFDLSVSVFLHLFPETSSFIRPLCHPNSNSRIQKRRELILSVFE